MLPSDQLRCDVQFGSMAESAAAAAGAPAPGDKKDDTSVKGLEAELADLPPGGMLPAVAAAALPAASMPDAFRLAPPPPPISASSSPSVALPFSALHRLWACVLRNAQ